MMNLCKCGLIEDKIFFFVAENDNVVRINAEYNVFGIKRSAIMDITHEEWEKAVEDFVFSEHYNRREK